MIKTWTGLIVEDLKASYQQHHPDRLKFFYRLVMDIGDYKTQELTLDEVWEFEKKMHMPEEKGDLAIKKFFKKWEKKRFFYPCEVNCKLVMGNGSLTPICSLSPSLTV